jgi:hypothetical protein
MSAYNMSQSPMESRLKLSKQSSVEPVDTTGYKSIMGVLCYLLHTWSDLAFPVGYLSWFMEAPHDDHLAAIKCLLRYVVGMCNHGLHYTRRDEGWPKLARYYDGDLMGDVDTRKITSGIVFFLNDNSITWQATKQRVVALSSYEVEYITVAAAACQGIWLGWLLTELVGSTIGTPVLFIDNQSTIALCRNPVFHDRSKHIDVRYHFIQECIEEGSIIVRYMAMMEQLADLLTKTLGRNHF